MSTRFSVTALSPFGAIVEGLDASRALEDDAVAELRSYLMEHHVLIFRDQEALTDPQYVRLMSHFGRPFINDTDESGPDRFAPSDPEILLLTSGIDDNGKPVGYVGEGPRGLGWHTDYCWAAHVSEFGALKADIVTTTGGATCFSNMYSVYDSLGPQLQTQIAALTARHELRLSPSEPVIRSAEHPLVVTNPYNGRRALYANRLYTAEILGLPTEQAAELLSRLIDFSLAERFILEHKWSPHDLVIWDQIGLIHCRTPFDADEPRMVRQISLVGDDSRAPWVRHPEAVAV